MQFAKVNVKTHPGTLASDRCARSGLMAGIMEKNDGDPVSFSTLYTTHFAEMSVFYRKILGEESVRIDGDGLLVFGHSWGSVVIKRVRDDSQFAKLAGRQSLGIIGMAPTLTGCANTSVSEELEWDTNVTQINDPDGNVVLFAEPESAKANQKKTANY